MSLIPPSRFAAAVLTVAILAPSAAAQAYGSAAPMSVSTIEAQAPVANVNATPTAPAEARTSRPSAPPQSPVRKWIAEVRRRIDGAVEIALH